MFKANRSLYFTVLLFFLLHIASNDSSASEKANPVNSKVSVVGDFGTYTLTFDSKNISVEEMSKWIELSPYGIYCSIERYTVFIAVSSEEIL